MGRLHVCFTRPGQDALIPQRQEHEMNNAKAIALVALMSVSSFAMAAYTGPKEQNKGIGRPVERRGR